MIHFQIRLFWSGWGGSKELYEKKNNQLLYLKTEENIFLKLTEFRGFQMLFFAILFSFCCTW